MKKKYIEIKDVKIQGAGDKVMNLKVENNFEGNYPCSIDWGTHTTNYIVLYISQKWIAFHKGVDQDVEGLVINKF